MGVVGTMWSQNATVAQNKARNFLLDASMNLLPDYTYLPRAAPIVNDAEHGIAYLNMPDHANLLQLRRSIGELASFIASQMGIPQPAQAMVA